jgi:hypothetical protein
MMDLHSEDSMLSDCLTSNSCPLGILPLGIGVLLKNRWAPFIVATWRVSMPGERPTSKEEHCASWKRASSPR